MRVPRAILRIAPDGQVTPQQRRRLMIDMTLRRARPGCGSSREFLRRMSAVRNWPDLQGILGDIPWAVVGGVATRAYMPERMTKDLDVLVERKIGPVVLEILKGAGFSVESELTIPGRALRSPEGVEVNLLLGDDDWVPEALRSPGRDPAGLPVLRLPFLVLMKLTATRTQDWADLSRMLGLAADEDLDEVRTVVSRHRPEDREDLEALIHLGRLEHQPPE